MGSTNRRCNIIFLALNQAFQVPRYSMHTCVSTQGAANVLWEKLSIFDQTSELPLKPAQIYIAWQGWLNRSISLPRREAFFALFSFPFKSYAAWAVKATFHAKYFFLSFQAPIFQHLLLNKWRLAAYLSCLYTFTVLANFPPCKKSKKVAKSRFRQACKFREDKLTNLFNWEDWRKKSFLSVHSAAASYDA